MRRWTFGMVAALVFVAGCGGDEPNPPAAPTTTTEAGTSTKQTANIVAKHREAILDAFVREDECKLTVSLREGRPVTAPDDNACDNFLNQYARWSQIIELYAALTGELDEAKPVVQEVAALVDATIEVAGVVKPAQDAVDECLNLQVDSDQPFDEDNCTFTQAAWEKAWRAMKPLLAIWERYI